MVSAIIVAISLFLSFVGLLSASLYKKSFIPPLLCAVPGIVFFVLALAINSPQTTIRKTDSTTTNIDTLSLASAHGSFVLGTGNINGKDVYYYMAKTPDGDQLKLLDNDENNVFIKQDAEDQAELVYYETYYIIHVKDKSLAMMFDPIEDYQSDDEGNIQKFDYDSGEKYIFHVPAGTLIQGYKVDPSSLQ